MLALGSLDGPAFGVLLLTTDDRRSVAALFTSVKRSGVNAFSLSGTGSDFGGGLIGGPGFRSLTAELLDRDATPTDRVILDFAALSMEMETELFVAVIPPQPQAAMGLMVGEVTEQGALVQARLTASDKPVDGDVPGLAGVVEFVLEEAGTGRFESRQLVEAVAERDFIARAVLENLRPATRYRCRTRIGANAASLRSGPVAEFNTLAGPQRGQDVKFAVVTGMNHEYFYGNDYIDPDAKHPTAYAGPDKHLGYPALASILALQPDFFVGTGDNVYYDTPGTPRARTVAELRQKWHEQFAQPRFRELFAAVPTYWMIDDHDYRKDDCDNSGDYDPSPAVAQQIMLEQLPLAAGDDEGAKTYRTHRVSRDLQLWFPEHRVFRHPNLADDGPDKSIWGTEQKAWLQRTLLQSDATFKLLVSPTPLVGPDDLRKKDNHTNVGGFRHERDEFFGWLEENTVDKQRFYVVCGDRHWQYHSIHPSGIQEMGCGALVDANSRLGRKPGDPRSTDPEGLIVQPYCQESASGGFLLIQSSPAGGAESARLTFSWYDETGALLHRHTTSAD